jgi:hypothetical protein
LEEQLIEFETAKLAAEKGLKRRGELIKEGQTLKINLDGIKCNTCFNLQGNPTTPKYVHNDQQYVRPTQSLLQKWLREKHDIEIYVRSSVDLYNKKYWTTFLPNGCLENKNNTYEEALEFGLQKGLKLIQQ